MLFPVLKDLIKLKTAVNAAGVVQKRAGNTTHGDYTSLFHGIGVEFETVRQYVVGDDVRHIDWRVTARSGKPHIKTYRAECDRNVFVVVDANAYMRFGTRNTFKSVQAAKVAALLCWKSLQLQDRIGGLIFGDVPKGMQYFKPSKSDNVILRMLKLLCSPETAVHVPVTISDALQQVAKVITPQSLVLVISDFSFDDAMAIEKALITLRKNCTLMLLPVCDPADKDIPAMGPIIFNHGGQDMVINTDDPQARKKYNAAWQDYQQRMTHIGKKLKAPLLWIETISDPIKALFAMSGTVTAWKT